MSDNSDNGRRLEIKVSAEAEDRIRDLLSKYPKANSAIMPALYIAQETFGWIDDRAIAWVAERIGVAPSHVRAVSTFYTMYYKAPVGKYHIQVCRTLSCSLRGGREIVAHLKERLGLESGEVSEDGMWSYEEVECLGSCGTAPMAEINDVYFENLTVEKLDALLDRIEREQPDLRYSTIKGSLGKGLVDLSRSQAWKVGGGE